MTTMSTATVTQVDASATATTDKTAEKVEKRRALGRGLDSLLPSGPRVVPATAWGAGQAPTAAVAGQAPATGVGPVPSTGGTSPIAPVEGGGPTEVTHPMHDTHFTGPVGDRLADRGDGDMGKVALGGASLQHSEAVSDEAGGADAGMTASSHASAIHPAAPHMVAPHAATPHTAPRSAVLAELHAQAVRMPGETVVQIALDHIDRNPYQTRRSRFTAEDLQELAESIEAHGVIQPVTVRPGKEGRYVLITGERRMRASKQAGKRRCRRSCAASPTSRRRR